MMITIIILKDQIKNIALNVNWLINLSSSSQKHIHFKQLNDLIMHTQVDIRQVNITLGNGVTGTIMVR